MVTLFAVIGLIFNATGFILHVVKQDYKKASNFHVWGAVCLWLALLLSKSIF